MLCIDSKVIHIEPQPDPVGGKDRISPNRTNNGVGNTIAQQDQHKRYYWNIGMALLAMAIGGLVHFAPQNS